MALAIGIGFRSQCSIDELQALIAKGLGKADVDQQNIAILATHQRKTNSPQLHALNALYGWRIHLFSSKQLATCCKELHAEISHVSPVAINTLATPSVAEASALLALYEKGTLPTLRLPLLRSAGATIAIAEARGCISQLSNGLGSR